MYKIILLMAIIAHSLTACTFVRYYEVKPMAQNFNKTAAAANDILKKVRTDIKQKRMALHSLKNQGANLQSAPYAELHTLLGPLQKHARQGEAKVKELHSLKTKFRSIGKGKKKITSKSPDYGRVDKLKNRAQVLMPELENIVKAYGQDAKKFETAAKKGRVGELDVTKTRSDLNRFLKKLDSNISLVRSRGSKIQAATLGKKQNTYKQITLKLALIEQERAAVAKLIHRFNKVSGSQKKIWMGPGLLSFDIMTRAQALANKIQKIGNEISALSHSLKK